MIYKTGNLLEAETQALVNTVNTVGVMGKGIALQFKERFPQNFKIYADACKKGLVKVGRMLIVNEHTLEGEKIIINFPTKEQWFKKSQYRFIEEGLQALAQEIRTRNIKSIALPPLGCGNGGLNWEKIKPMINHYLSGLEGVEIVVFEPNEAVKEILQNEQQKKQVELTPGRAMLLYALFRYERLGEVASIFAANKLAYFLQESGEKLKLQFTAYTYGPYAQAVEKVLYSMNGKYLTGLEQMQARPFEPLKLNWEKLAEVESYIKTSLSDDQKQRIENIFQVIDGFESTLSLEILSSIHYLLSEDPKLSQKQLLSKIQTWNDRKRQMIKEEYIEIAVEHLANYGRRLNFA
ncbi:phosphatase [Pedobacter antarcticus 4BY]|uniref:Phosphatase n=2 Tax=Pedobacter antarcticus TaxID=34086 RepID=A0A081PI19_9SPHI|nr:macro domain-containing protein [Pedobacter antarcticus]KEQ30342.1 phosphatase [Pedobacter antarcticus 4BY]SFE73582.1 O-acetyl-ADP-ribose deacetylase (regulator of RNase III), contains Macro domain [Pedobacter antarcticus]